MTYHPDADREPAPIVVDARGLNCPLPVLKLRKCLRHADPAVPVILLATDRAALRDVPAYCETQGYAVAVEPDAEGVLRFAVSPRRATGP